MAIERTASLAGSALLLINFGLGILYLMASLPLWELLKWMRYSVYAWLVLGVLAAGFLLLRWRTLKALSKNRASSALDFGWQLAG